MTTVTADLQVSDLPSITWAGSVAHLKYVEKALIRAARGDVDYLAISVDDEIVHYAELAVEVENRRARLLYERLGYEQVGFRTDSWNQEDAQGNVVIYSADCVVMRKALSKHQ